MINYSELMENQSANVLKIHPVSESKCVETGKMEVSRRKKGDAVIGNWVKGILYSELRTTS